MKVVSDRQVCDHLLASLTQKSILSEYQPALLEALAAFELDPAVSPERTVQTSSTPGSDATHLFMPCIAPHGVGVKVISGGPTNSSRGLGFQGCLVVLDEYTGQLQAVVNGKALTAFRTALASTLGLVHVFVPLENPPKLPELLVFGSGPQAYWHAVLAARLYPEITQINIISRSLASAGQTAQELRAVVAQNVSAFELADESAVCAHVTNSSVIFGCTPSTSGLIRGHYINLDPAITKYILLIGSYKPHMYELDLDWIREHYTGKTTKILVDTKAGTLAEAGELIQGGVGAGQLVSLVELSSGESGVSQCVSDTGVVLLKIVGLLVMDIFMAKHVMQSTEGAVVDF